MNRQLTAIIECEGDGYVALCPEVDVASQGDTEAEARDNLAEALTLFFETAGAEEVGRRLRDEVYVTHVEVAIGQASRAFGSRGLSYSWAIVDPKFRDAPMRPHVSWVPSCRHRCVRKVCRWC